MLTYVALTKSFTPDMGEITEVFDVSTSSTLSGDIDMYMSEMIYLDDYSFGLFYYEQVEYIKSYGKTIC